MKAQTNWAEIGDPDWGPYCIWKFQILDDYNNQPLVDSKVELLRDNFRLVSIRANQDGIAVVIINDITELDNNEKLIIRDKNYEYNSWETDIYQKDYYGKRSKQTMLILPSQDNTIVNWTGSPWPNSEEIAALISEGRYNLYESGKDNYTYFGPGFFEYKIRLTYDKHPRDRTLYDDKHTKSSNTANSLYGEVPNGWTESINEYGEIIFLKGNTELLLSGSDDINFNDVVVVFGRLGASSHNYVKGRDGVSMNEAIRIAYEYMRNH